MSNVVEFVVVLVVSMIGSSQAASCYRCNYTHTPPSSFQSSCNYPFTPTVTKNCLGSICSWKFSNYTSPTSYFNINLGCLNASGSATDDPCAQYRTQYNVFNYSDSCCYTATVQGSNSITTCFCQSDYCNADTSNPQAPPSGPTSAPLPAPSDSTPQSTMSLMKPSAWAMIVFTIIATVPNIV